MLFEQVPAAAIATLVAMFAGWVLSQPVIRALAGRGVGRNVRIATGAVLGLALAIPAAAWTLSRNGNGIAAFCVPFMCILPYFLKKEVGLPGLLAAMALLFFSLLFFLPAV